MDGCTVRCVLVPFEWTFSDGVCPGCRRYRVKCCLLNAQRWIAVVAVATILSLRASPRLPVAMMDSMAVT